MKQDTTEFGITFVGHPYGNIGKGEELRSSIRSWQSVEGVAGVIDIYGLAPRTDPDHLAVFHACDKREAPFPVRVFHVNGDEVAQVLDAFAYRGRFADGYNIVVPAWELPVFPPVWVEQLRRFDEIWAISRFVQAGLEAAGLASRYVGQSVELPIRPFLSRRHFGIRESAFAVLTFLDLSSYATRKNPGAVLEVFRRLRRQRPFADVQLVLKVKQADQDADAWCAALRDEFRDDVFVTTPLNTHETHSLVHACDCLASLHRAEGFGRGVGEAMWLGRVPLATGWSGNVDFMGPENALPVDYTLVDVAEGDYPAHAGQQWAEPDVDHACHLLQGLLDDDALYRRLSRQARLDIRATCSNRAVGLRMLDRYRAVAGVAATRVPEADAATGVAL